jgi:sec-independent protein translocase protein TatA
MFGLGLPEMLVIGVIIFILFGAKRIPEIGAGLGKTVKELRRIRDERRGEKKEVKGNQNENLSSDSKKETGKIPGLKEAKELKETIGQVNKFTKLMK